ncbi:MAG: AAA family ATPase [Magnetococcales bacterium]|nr:AAA family ATPase [Magnetococcales bacterium]
MIRRLKIGNFKSLDDLSVPMSKLTCLIGLNGSGKSTFLQAMDFLAHVITGEVKSWLTVREWSNQDLTCRLLTKRLIGFHVELAFPASPTVSWNGSYNPATHRCHNESVAIEDDSKVIFFSKPGSYSEYSTGSGSENKITFDYQGSILSRLKTDNPHLLQLKTFFTELKSLELLSPHLMRHRARTAADIGLGGEKLSAFLYGLPKENRAQIIAALQTLYPHLTDFHISNQRPGWKKLSIQEDVAAAKPMLTEARHINDGLLRQLAIVAQTYSNHRCLLFDEIENGMNQEIIGKLIDILLKARQQIVITTHSPQILNFLPDDVARESVLFFYKTPQGFSRARRFFDLPLTAKKLAILGPGEVYADTDLEALVQEALRLDNGAP